MNGNIEPGLLRVFRIFAFFQFLFIVASLASFSSSGHPKHPFAVLSSLALLTILLIVYLSIPALERALGRLYLPLAVMTAVLIPIAGEFMALFYGSAADFNDISEETIALLLLPLLVISWQYRFKVVVLFVVCFGLMEMMLFQVASMQSGGPGIRTYHRLITGRSIAFLAGGYLITWLMNEQRKQRRSLARANAELSHYATTLEQLTISRERNRMARELHDTLAHTLSGIAVQLEAMRSLWNSEPAEARSLLDRSLGTARQGLAETRRALQALRATPLEDMGLALAIQDLAERAAGRAGLELQYVPPLHMPELAEETEQGIYRIAQEALENVVRHANAKNVNLGLSYENDQVILQICDDGRGFDVDDIAEGKLGLRGMQERAALLHGALSIEANNDCGTKVKLIVPAAASEVNR